MPTRTTRIAFALLFFAAAMYLGWLQKPLTKAFTIDNQIYYFLAERVASNEPPHISLADHKHQLSSILSGAAIALGRLVGVDDVVSVRALSMTVAAGTVASVWLLALRLSGTLLGAHLAGLVMLTYTDFFHQGTMGVRPKVFMAFFLALALLAFTADKRTRSGAYAAFSFLCWQPALLVLGGLGLTTLLERDRWKNAARLTVGAAVAVLAYEAYFVWHGALAEQLYQSYAMPADAGAYKLPEFTKSLRFIIRMGLWREDSHFVFPVTFLVGLASCWIHACVRPRATWEFMRSHPGGVGAIAVSHLALAFTMINHQAYPDMFFLQPLIAAVCGVVLGGIAHLAVKLPRQVLPWALGTLCALFILNSAVARTTIFGQRAGLTVQDQKDLAKQVELLADQYGPVWAIGCPHLLAFNHTANHTPYGLLIDRKLTDYILRKAGEEPYMPLKDGRLPGVILVARGGERKIVPWLPYEYFHMPDTAFAKQGIRLWLRRPARPARLENPMRPAAWRRVTLPPGADASTKPPAVAGGASTRSAPIPPAAKAAPSGIPIPPGAKAARAAKAPPGAATSP